MRVKILDYSDAYRKADDAPTYVVSARNLTGKTVTLLNGQPTCGDYYPYAAVDIGGVEYRLFEVQLEEVK